MISVVIPTYNRKAMLPRAVQSVLAQTYHELEVVVVDDASTDGTEALFAHADPRVRYERLARNSGVHAARNRGLEIANGEFISFLDSDDELSPEALEKGLGALNDPAYGLVMAPFRLDSGGLTGFDRKDGEMPFADLLCERGVRSKKTGFCLIRRSAIGSIRWPMKNLDFVFFRRVGVRTRIYYIAEPLGVYRTEGEAGAMTRARKIPNAELSIERAKVLDEFLDEFGAMILESCPRRFGYYAYGAAVGLLLDGESARARRRAREALRLQPRLRYLFFYAFAFVPFSPSLLWALFSAKRGFQDVR
ncbi:MAG TPA: glycosyltransferase family 2 protein [Candidatus Paceibacterota bacterium]|jgi:glycosyltransferase involved in cell wall biosynthesis|nr:glycosyltransferase family 2 protein [Candidatus Paceibacterota bacterium]